MDHLREHLRKVHAKDKPKISRRKRDPPAELGRKNAYVEAPSKIKGQVENYDVYSSRVPIEPAEDIGRHRKALELPEAIMDLGDGGVPRRSIRLGNNITGQTHAVGLPGNMAKVTDAAQMKSLESLFEAMDGESPHLAQNAQANIKPVRKAPQYKAFVINLLSLRIELRVWLGRRASSPTIHISTNGETLLEDGKQRIRWTCVSRLSLTILPGWRLTCLAALWPPSV